MQRQDRDLELLWVQEEIKKVGKLPSMVAQYMQTNPLLVAVMVSVIKFSLYPKLAPAELLWHKL